MEAKHEKALRAEVLEFLYILSACSYSEYNFKINFPDRISYYQSNFFLLEGKVTPFSFKRL